MLAPVNCLECGDKMTECEMPTEGTIFRIPFTEIDIIWRKWNSKEYICLSCASDKQQEQGRSAYNAGLEDGYSKAYEERHRGW